MEQFYFSCKRENQFIIEDSLLNNEDETLRCSAGSQQIAKSFNERDRFMGFVLVYFEHFIVKQTK